VSLLLGLHVLVNILLVGFNLLLLGITILLLGINILLVGIDLLVEEFLLSLRGGYETVKFQA
jgi:hypothetical protein